MNGICPQESRNKSSKSKRIASNTILLFVRMFGIMVINLYAVRLVLQSLGEVNYGVFNTIAGIVLTSSFLNTTLTISIQRFYSYALGEQATNRLIHIFSASMTIVILLSITIFLLFETIGLWFVKTQINIPEDTIETALWLYQFAILTLILSFIQIPYTAAIFSHEDMGTYALFSLFECLARLMVAIIIAKVVLPDNLLFYGAGLAIVALLVFIAYSSFSRRQYIECHYIKNADKHVYKELISFSGWTTYSALSGMSIIHGNTILLNVFFGPVATASFAIANQIHNAITALGNSIVIAFRPAMVKAYAEKDFTYLDTLFYYSNKSILYLLLCVSVPLFIEMPIILHWWLGAASSQMILFSRLFILFMILLMMLYPISTIIQSSGKIKYYTLWVDSITLMTLPITWFFYKLGAPDYCCFISLISVFLIAHFVRLICLRYYYNSFTFSNYFKQLIIPGITISTLSVAIAYTIHLYTGHQLWDFILVSFFSPTATLLLTYTIGLSNKEKHLLYTFLYHLIKRQKA